MVAVTAVRIGEALGLMWSDIDWHKLKIHIRRAWVYGELGPPKSRASKAAVEMHETLAALLHAWRQRTLYGKDSDFVFASHKLHGEKPRLGSMIVQDYVRPAAVAAGVIPQDCQRFGFHNLRHGLATYLMENGHDPFVVQRMLRHSSVEQTMHYVHNRRQARKAQGEYLVAFLPNGGVIEEKAPAPALSGGQSGCSEGSEIVSGVASAVE